MTRRPSYRHTFLTASAFVFATCAMAATTCDNLSKLSLPQTVITMAASVTPGAFAPPASFSLNLQPGDVAYKNLPAFAALQQP